MSREITLPPPDQPTADGVRSGGWWCDADDGRRLRCRLCPRGCLLRPGERGFCFVRQNRDGRMVSTTYGRSTGFCLDPIEKKPLCHFYPGTSVLSFGTAGCNLGCKFCQNWSTSKSRDVEAACEAAAPESIAQAALSLGCRSVAFTYNDPVIWAEYAIDTARACRSAGVKTVAVTAGYIAPEARGPFFEHIDAANVDLKGFSDDFYRSLTGGRLEPVLDTLRWLVHHSDTWLEITNLVIPQANDSPQQIEGLCRWVVEELGPDVPLHFSAFHPAFKLIDRGPTPPETLAAAHDIARRCGLRYVYTGNISDHQRQHTYCPGCGQAVIERDGYRLLEYRIRGGRCAQCDAPIAGRLDDLPGDWGGGCVPVRIGELLPPLPPGEGRGEGAAVNANDFRPRSGTAALTPCPSPKGRGEPAAGRPLLSQEQERRVFQAAGQRVAATVEGRSAEPLRALLGEIADMPLYGSFVSLKRGGQLRACCGFLGLSVSLAEAVKCAAIRAAKDDPRFTPISPHELDSLDMEVWLLWGLEPVPARGRDRIQAVTIGKHGVQVAQGSARGLLLPAVAVEHHLDAKAFLQQVCLKAGLPPDAWLRDDTTLSTFEGYAIRGRLAETLVRPADGLDGRPIPASPSFLTRQPSIWQGSQGLPWSNHEVIVGCSPNSSVGDGPSLRNAPQGTTKPGLPPRPNSAGQRPAAQPAASEDRPAAVAGAFYPEEPAEMDHMLDEFLLGQPAEPPQAWAAALVPHAGWVYSGRLAAAVLSRVKIPERVVIFAPRHHGEGPGWAVAPYRRWLIPGGQVAGDIDLARQLAGAVKGLELDSRPHRREHAIEVQLPILHRLAPQSRVVGITIGPGDLPGLRRFAEQLAGLLAGLPERPLLVISSDMNHFADESRTRSLDRLALDAMLALDPARLYETVEEHQISMCGMRPAVIVMETLGRLGLLRSCQEVGYTTSAEHSGDTSRVVGYAGLLLG
jgi:AmmeMemoRadiSam system radical SAM enzyme/AmmeMemoRadiSam system protein B/AmmeMemoRadiSam system protein A